VKYSVRSESLTSILQSGLDPDTAEPHLFRQVRVLNSLMLSAMGICIPISIFWTLLLNASYSYPYLIAFSAWGLLILTLRQTLNVTLVGRAAVFVFFTLCTSSIVLLGGAESNLLAWYMLMPIVTAICVGRRDLWFWGIVATLTPMIHYLFPG